VKRRKREFLDFVWRYKSRIRESSVTVSCMPGVLPLPLLHSQQHAAAAEWRLTAATDACYSSVCDDNV